MQPDNNTAAERRAQVNPPVSEPSPERSVQAEQLDIFAELRRSAGMDDRLTALVNVARSVLARHTPALAEQIGQFAVGLATDEKHVRDEELQVIRRRARQALNKAVPPGKLPNGPRVAAHWASSNAMVQIWRPPSLLAAALHRNPPPRSRRPGVATNHELFAAFGLQVLRVALGSRPVILDAVLDAAACILPLAGPKSLPREPEKRWVALLKMELGDIDRRQRNDTGRRPTGKQVYKEMERRYPGYGEWVERPNFQNVLTKVRKEAA